MRNISNNKTNGGEFILLQISTLRSRLLLIAALGVGVAIFQFACSKNSKVGISANTPTRIALLPFNTPEKSKELRWTAMAAPVAMAQASLKIKDIEAIPLWRSMPLAIQTAGNSRILTQESAASVAIWLSAKWAAYGDFQPHKKGVHMIIDFIPGEESMIPFRHMKTGKLDAIQTSFHKAYQQFIWYESSIRLAPEREKAKGFESLRNLAEALDREYGWSVEPEPGKAQEIVADLIKTDEQLARYLFSPTLYPALQPKD